jgi:hypothetical protein
MSARGPALKKSPPTAEKRLINSAHPRREPVQLTFAPVDPLNSAPRRKTGSAPPPGSEPPALL